jgi:hypothetical protein
MRMFKQPAMTLVSPKKHGTVRENSLYHFLMDHLHLERLAAYRTHVGVGERQVIYIDFPIENPQANALFDGFKIVGQHLSVDKLVIHEESFLAQKLTPAHGTLVCENDEGSERLVAHVYFNRQGELTHSQAKSYSLVQGQWDMEEGRVRVISDKEQALLHLLAQPIQDLLGHLLNQKATSFIELYQESFELDDALSHAIVIKNKPEAVKNANELIALTSKLTRYNDIEQDGRVTYLKRMVSQFEIGDLFRVDSSPPESLLAAMDDEDGPDSAQLLLTRQAPSPKLSKHDQAKREIIMRVDELVYLRTASAEQNLGPYLVEVADKYQHLDRCLLALELSSSSAVTAFIAQQRARLPIRKSLNEYFNERVLAGDFENVVVLFPTLVPRTNMFRVVGDLLLAIRNTPDSLHSENLIKIADFFNDELEIYRSLMMTCNQMFKYDTAAQLAQGFLCDFFQSNSVLGFSMALRHGVPCDSAQMMSGTTMCNALQMLILCYGTNPNVIFVQKLIEAGAKMTFSANKAVAVPPAVVQRFFHEKAIQPMTLKDDSQSEVSVRLKRLTKIDHALLLACDMWSATHPELVIELAKHSDAEHLVIASSTLLNLNIFSSRFLPFSLYAVSGIFINKRACDEATQILISQGQTSTLPKQYCSLLFYCSLTRALKETEMNLFRCANELLKQAKHGFSALSRDDQRRIIKHITARAAESKNLNEHLVALQYYRAVQLAYTLIEHPEMMDHQAMAQTIAFVAASVKKIRKDYPPQAMYLEAYNFLKFLSHTLSDKDLAFIETTPIYRFLLDKIKEFNLENNRLDWMPANSACFTYG